MYTLEYRKGADNEYSDALSRREQDKQSMETLIFQVGKDKF